MSQIRILCLLVIGNFLGLAFTAQGAVPPPVNPADQMLQQQLKQQQLKATTRKVRDQLDSIIGEFERNDIRGEDLNSLRIIRSVLGDLTEKDMELVLQYLGQAREEQGKQGGQFARHATEAYAQQRSVKFKLDALVEQYRLQAELYELSLRFKEFATRQTGYMWQAVELAKRINARPLTSFNENERADLRLLEVDQGPLKDEVLMQVKKLREIVNRNLHGPAVQRSGQALHQAENGGMLPALDAALERLRTAKLMDATGRQREARDQFREIARLLLLTQGENEALREALRELDQVIDQQKQVQDETKKPQPKDSGRQLDIRQAQVGDNADLLRRDVESIAPQPAEQLKNATDKMADAREAFQNERDPTRMSQKAAPSQAEALAALEQARQAMADQLARAEAGADNPQNNLDNLKQLQEQVRELAKQEEQLKNDMAQAEKKSLVANAPKQGELKDKTQQAQQKAAPTPAAAKRLSEAATQMQAAQSSMANGENNSPAQEAATEALKAADQQLSQDIAQLEKAQRDLAQVEELMQKLQGVIQEQQKVQAATSKEALQKSAKPVPELSGQQDKLAKATDQLHQESGTPAPKAAASLQKATGEMQQAKTQLDRPAPTEAQQPQAQALSDLYAAKKELAAKRDELAQMLGMPSEMSAQAMADSDSVIEQAQKDVSQALEKMQAAPPGLLESLVEQQRQVASGLGQLARNGTPAHPLSDAHKAAGQAAEQLAQGSLPQAVEAMKQAQAGMNQAPDKTPPQTPQPAEAQPQAPPNAPPPSLAELSRQQAKVRSAVEAMLSAQQSAPDSGMQEAGKLLEHADHLIRPLAAGQQGGLPPGAQSALQSAQQALSSGAAQAQAQQRSPAQASANSAAQSLAQAQAALALAQAGVTSSSPMAGAKPGQGKGQQPGHGQQPGPGQMAGQGTPAPRGTGRQGNWQGTGGAEGPRKETTGPGEFTGLPARDRAALQQSQSEKYPAEYGALVEQYMKNLSDQASDKSGK